MKMFLNILAMLLCISLLADISYAKGRRHSHHRQEQPAPRKAPSQIQQKSAAEPDPKKDVAGLEMYEFIDSLFSVGDSVAAVEQVVKLIENHPGDPAAKKLLEFLENIWIKHGKIPSAPDIDGSYTNTIAPQVDLLIIKAYSAVGRNGYALYLACQMETRYAGTEWAEQAKTLAESLGKKVVPISLESPQPE